MTVLTSSGSTEDVAKHAAAEAEKIAAEETAKGTAEDTAKGPTEGTEEVVAEEADKGTAKEADKALQQVLEQLETLTDQTKDMTDAELAETIQGIAGEYHLTLNDEQMKFLISACRTLETAQSVGQTAQDVGEQVSKFGDTVHDISQSVGKVADTVSGLFD